MDETIIFNRLDEEHIFRIAALQLEHLAARPREQRIALEVTESAQRYLAEAGFDRSTGRGRCGGRSKQQVQNPLAKLLIGGKLTDGSRVTVAGPGLDFHVTHGAAKLH